MSVDQFIIVVVSFDHNFVMPILHIVTLYQVLVVPVSRTITRMFS